MENLWVIIYHEGLWNELFWFDQNVIWFLKILKIFDDGLGYKQKGQTSTTDFLFKFV